MAGFGDSFTLDYGDLSRASPLHLPFGQPPRLPRIFLLNRPRGNMTALDVPTIARSVRLRLPIAAGTYWMLADHGAAYGHDQGDDAIDGLGGFVLGRLEVAGGGPERWRAGAHPFSELQPVAITTTGFRAATGGLPPPLPPAATTAASISGHSIPSGLLQRATMASSQAAPTAPRNPVYARLLRHLEPGAILTVF
jgi:hypothetical protein